MFLSIIAKTQGILVEQRNACWGSLISWQPLLCFNHARSFPFLSFLLQAGQRIHAEMSPGWLISRSSVPSGWSSSIRPFVVLMTTCPERRLPAISWTWTTASRHTSGRRSYWKRCWKGSGKNSRRWTFGARSSILWRWTTAKGPQKNSQAVVVTAAPDQHPHQTSARSALAATKIAPHICWCPSRFNSKNGSPDQHGLNL